MPHSAVKLATALNAATSDPEDLSNRKGAIDAASSVSDLVAALGVSGQPGVAEAAAAADAFLPPAVIQAGLAAYRGAAAAGNDAVLASWRPGLGFSVAVSHAPGTHPVDDLGVVSVQIASPPLPPPSQA
jgi:hypothetical protein